MARPRTMLSVQDILNMDDRTRERFREAAQTSVGLARFVDGFLNPEPARERVFSRYSTQDLTAVQQLLRRLDEAAEAAEANALLADPRWQTAWKVLVGFMTEDSRRRAVAERFVERELEKSSVATSGDSFELSKPKRTKQRTPPLTPEERAARMETDPVYAARVAAMAKAREVRRENRENEQSAHLAEAGVA